MYLHRLNVSTVNVHLIQDYVFQKKGFCASRLWKFSYLEEKSSIHIMSEAILTLMSLEIKRKFKISLRKLN